MFRPITQWFFRLALLISVIFAFCHCAQAETQKHVWEKVEIVLKAQGDYENPYMEVDVWADTSTAPAAGRAACGAERSSRPPNTRFGM